MEIAQQISNIKIIHNSHKIKNMYFIQTNLYLGSHGGEYSGIVYASIRSMSLCTGRVRYVASDSLFPSLSSWDVATWSFTDRTNLSFEVKHSTTRAKRQSLRAVISSQISTTSLTSMLRRWLVHFRRLLIESRYSWRHWVQKMFAKYWTRRRRLDR